MNRDLTMRRLVAGGLFRFFAVDMVAVPHATEAQLTGGVARSRMTTTIPSSRLGFPNVGAISADAL